MVLTCVRPLSCALALMMASALQYQHAILTESGGVELEDPSAAVVYDWHAKSELDGAAQRWRNASLLRSRASRLNATGGLSEVSSSTSRPVKGRSSQPSLFCFALTLPTGNEPKLLAYHFKKGLGVFGCDGHAIYSNVTSDKFASPLPQGLNISVLNESMETGFVPLWDGLHSLNSHVFEMVWRRVYSDAAYRQYDWIVKVDLDTVVNHAHLRRLLSAQDHTRAMYVQNVDLGWFGFLWPWLSLHGAIEVLSAKAVETYVNWLNFCNFFMPLPAGEDVFLAGCMGLLLVPGVYEGNLLKEYGGCDCSFGALHPFKGVEAFAACERKCAGS
mmetsp:Transcript_52049/g.111409  ORF Transcript_52049/g.111409 Transcript_52049/m.111409 type:complete len:330 (-) Transcript_52049:129-1118(-)